MLSRGGPQATWRLRRALALWPGICAWPFVVFAINIFGDALRDLLDPRLRGGAGRFSAPRRKPHTTR